MSNEVGWAGRQAGWALADACAILVCAGCMHECMHACMHACSERRPQALVEEEAAPPSPTRLGMEGCMLAWRSGCLHRRLTWYLAGGPRTCAAAGTPPAQQAPARPAPGTHGRSTPQHTTAPPTCGMHKYKCMFSCNTTAFLSSQRTLPRPPGLSARSRSKVPGLALWVGVRAARVRPRTSGRTRRSCL